MKIKKKFDFGSLFLVLIIVVLCAAIYFLLPLEYDYTTYIIYALIVLIVCMCVRYRKKEKNRKEYCHKCNAKTCHFAVETPENRKKTCRPVPGEFTVFFLHIKEFADVFC